MTHDEENLKVLMDHQKRFREIIQALRNEIEELCEQQNSIQHDLDYLGLQAINLQAKIARARNQ